MLLGVIADDFTGATDIAGFLVENGISTIQLNGIPETDLVVNSEAVVISLKIRSCAPQQAISQARSALKWLKQQQCRQYYFKYCSTFDSTAQGNIGPITDALLDALGLSFTVLSPALPVNGRTVYQGYLFVMQQLLAESGMRHHPVNPMTDSYLPRLMEAQASGRCTVIPVTTLEQGAIALGNAISAAQQAGYRYAVLDAVTERHLEIQGQALNTMPLVTGGSGLAIGLARQSGHASATGNHQAQQAGYPLAGRAVVLSGSCSVMTGQQVACYRNQAPSQAIDIARCIAVAECEHYARQLADWLICQPQQGLAPMLYATQPADELAKIQQQYGAKTASAAIEQLFAHVSRHLAASGFRRFIVAGGETSGVVSQALNIRGFHIGPGISPGVPWVTALNGDISLALKSGNFGDENFFARAQLEFPL